LGALPGRAFKAHLADKAVPAEAIRAKLAFRNFHFANDRAIYTLCNFAARTLCRSKSWRRIATRFDRNIKNSCQPSPSPHRLSGGSIDYGP